MKTVVLYIIVALVSCGAGYEFWAQHQEIERLQTSIRVLDYNDRYLKRQQEYLSDQQVRVFTNQRQISKAMKILNDNQKDIADAVRMVIRALSDSTHSSFQRNIFQNWTE
jgi:hypothetical protein